MVANAETITILDVGHGNCTILESGGLVAVLDAGPKGHLLEYLREKRIVELEWVVLSHSDDDHIGGIIALLSSKKVKIKKLRINSDSQKRSKTFDDFARLIGQLSREDMIDYMPSFTPRMGPELRLGDIEVEIVGPSDYIATKGPGSILTNGSKVLTNSISAVIRFLYRGRAVVIAAGDVDQVGFEDIKTNYTTIPTPILIYPHHGGFSGKSENAKSFAKEICQFVKPQSVIFSHGRDSGYQNPRQEIIDAILGIEPYARIVCTQLSKNCSSRPLESCKKHLNPIYASGAAGGKCCAGSIIIDLSDSISLYPSQLMHDDFKKQSIESAICL